MSARRNAARKAVVEATEITEPPEPLQCQNDARPATLVTTGNGAHEEIRLCDPCQKQAGR